MAKQLPQEKAIKIVELHRAGLTQKEIGAIVGADRNTVRHTIQRMVDAVLDKIHMPNTILHMMPKGIALKSDYGVR